MLAHLQSAGNYCLVSKEHLKIVVAMDRISDGFNKNFWMYLMPWWFVNILTSYSTASAIITSWWQSDRCSSNCNTCRPWFLACE